MKYLGIDVHSKTSVWALLNDDGQQVRTGKIPTTVPALEGLMSELQANDEVVAGQEVGTIAMFVHDAIKPTGAKLYTFNPYHLRMIAASRKKTDRRDAYWIAKALQTGMTPHPVYVPEGLIRELRELVARRRVIQRDRNRWQYRARAYLRQTGLNVRTGSTHLRKALDALTNAPYGIETRLLDAIGLCDRQIAILEEELAHVDAVLHQRTHGIEDIGRLMTIPGIGPIVATTLYATIGDVSRFPNAKTLCAYTGLVPSVRQSSDVSKHGRITKQGAPALRAALVQAAHIVTRCRGPQAEPLQAIFTRIRGTRGRRKVALVALARHLLRVAFHVLRDKTPYDPSRLSRPTMQ